MQHNFEPCLAKVLLHEGGFVNDPRDNGGATNKGITIGTLKRIGIDVDGDGDSDITDLKALKPEHIRKVYKTFYWDAVRGDYLPSGVDYVLFDFGVNSGNSRAIKHLQMALGFKGTAVDGDLGPKTIQALSQANPLDIIERVCDSRMQFLRGLSDWKHYKNGWSARVADVRKESLRLAALPKNHTKTMIPVIPVGMSATPTTPTKAPAPKFSIGSLLMSILAYFFSKGTKP